MASPFKIRKLFEYDKDRVGKVESDELSYLYEDFCRLFVEKYNSCEYFGNGTKRYRNVRGIAREIPNIEYSIEGRDRKIVLHTVDILGRREVKSTYSSWKDLCGYLMLMYYNIISEVKSTEFIGGLGGFRVERRRCSEIKWGIMPFRMYCELGIGEWFLSCCISEEIDEFVSEEIYKACKSNDMEMIMFRYVVDGMRKKGRYTSVAWLLGAYGNPMNRSELKYGEFLDIYESVKRLKGYLDRIKAKYRWIRIGSYSDGSIYLMNEMGYVVCIISESREFLKGFYKDASLLVEPLVDIIVKATDSGKEINSITLGWGQLEVAMMLESSYDDESMDMFLM